jgi:NAD+ diphosphatase
VPVLDALDYALGPSVFDVGGLDRMAEFRSDPRAMTRLTQDPEARAVVVRRGRAVMDEAGLVRVPLQSAPAGPAMLLGVGAEGPVFVVHPDEPFSDERARSVRSAVGLLTPDELGLFLHATALTAWHETHQRCPRCGGPTEIINAGYARRCPSDRSEHYPRTDPAVIVLVLDSTGDDSRCLLGRQAGWPEGRFSTLAGFVEPGETVEQAVAREVAEESGVEVERVSYAGSQPWPFPASLMLAYYAVAAPGSAQDMSVDGEEIVEARWFTREQLRSVTESGEVLVPPRLSVARRLVEGWLGHAVAGAGTWR